MLGFLQQFAHNKEMRQSRDEMLLGEIVRAMAREGHPAIQFRASEGRQMVRFKTVRDPVLNSVFIILDRRTGGSALSEAVLGSKATVRVTAEVKNRIADPDDLLHMYRTDLANLFKMPAMGGIKLDHQLNSVLATTSEIIEINDYVGKGEEGVQRLAALLARIIARLEEKLAPYKK